MILYLVRHARAMPIGGGVAHDRDRKLSPEGLLEAARLGKLFLTMDPGIGHVLTSPLLRAVQTGQEISRALRSGLEFRTTENLSPGLRPRALREELSALPGGANCVLVGHEPDMSMFLGDLCEAGHRPSIAFPPAAIAAVEMPGNDQTEARVRWLLHPELLALLFPTP
jgi:phosphohistidine phosphatase